MVKSLIKKLATTDLGIKFRNTFGIKPQIHSKNIPKSSSISDAFAWRTDGSYKTKFKFMDILDVFYDIKNSYVELKFYCKNNIFIKKIIINELDIFNEILIDKFFLDGVEDYGVFYIYHHSKDKILENEIISNRCYLSYSHNDNLYSVVHGNNLVNYFINKTDTLGENITKTSLLNNQIYKIQKFFDDFDKTQLFFTNPITEKINFLVNNKSFKLDGNCSIIIDIKNNEDTIIIKSNCAHLRPVVFNYKDDFIDVHHS